MDDDFLRDIENIINEKIKSMSNFDKIKFSKWHEFVLELDKKEIKKIFQLRFTNKLLMTDEDYKIFEKIFFNAISIIFCSSLIASSINIDEAIDIWNKINNNVLEKFSTLDSKISKR